MAKTRKIRRSYFAGRRIRYGFRRRSKVSIPLAIIGGFAPVAVGVWNRRNSATEVGDYLKAGFTGIGSDGRFNLANLRMGVMPVAAGFIVHAIASKFGVNRAIARAGIPWVRI